MVWLLAIYIQHFFTAAYSAILRTYSFSFHFSLSSLATHVNKKVVFYCLFFFYLEYVHNLMVLSYSGVTRFPCNYNKRNELNNSYCQRAGENKNYGPTNLIDQVLRFPSYFTRALAAVFNSSTFPKNVQFERDKDMRAAAKPLLEGVEYTPAKRCKEK